MSVVRNRPKGARFASFGLGLCVFALMPNEIGYQDIASLLARQPGVAERWQKRVFSAASTIQVATYSFGRPIGTSLPHPANYVLASLNNQGIDITGSVTRNPIAAPPPRYQPSDFPKVDRTLKGDRLVIAPPETVAPANAAPPLENPATSNASVRGAKTAAAAPLDGKAPLDPELQEALSAPPLAQYDVSMSLEAQPLDDLKSAPDASPLALDPAPSHDGFFGEDREPVLRKRLAGRPGRKHRALAARRRTRDRDAGHAARSRPEGDWRRCRLPPTTAARASPQKAKSMPTTSAPETPAERLGLLDEKSRAKSEKCLAEAVYFEARGEAVRGQIAVAQVVMNRTFSGFYPTTVCGVVYQNKHRHYGLPVHLRLRQRRRRRARARHVGSRQEDRQGDARRPALAAGSRRSRRTTMPIGCTRPGSAK